MLVVRIIKAQLALIQTMVLQLNHNYNVKHVALYNSIIKVIVLHACSNSFGTDSEL